MLAGGGILLAAAVLGPTVSFGTLGWVLPIAGIGIGMLLVPVTSVPLTVVRPERSGMAASATNTSREMGAVFGVAILGAIVNAKLTGDLAARLKAIGIPPNFQAWSARHPDRRCVSGGAASSAEHSKNATVARIATKVVNAAYNAFGSGLHVALVVSGSLILVGAVVAADHPRGRKTRTTTSEPRRGPAAACPALTHRRSRARPTLYQRDPGQSGCPVAGSGPPRPTSNDRIGDLQHALIGQDGDVREAH